MKVIRANLFILSVLILFLCGCKQNYTPKPRGYFRIDLPKKEYRKTPEQLPYLFEYPKYTYLQAQPNSPKKFYWVNMVFPTLKAKVYLSYKDINEDLDKCIEDAHEFVYKHTVKADAISEIAYSDEQKKVYGLLYEIKGDAASNVQFYLTDSVKNFVRGSLYFNALPNKDSLAPVVDFIEQDVKHLMETLEWK